MPIILLGVIGGVMAFGLVGLFIGASLAVGYVLFSDWVGATASGTPPMFRRRHYAPRSELTRPSTRSKAPMRRATIIARNSCPR